MVRIETNIDLLDNNGTSKLKRATTMGEICKHLEEGKRVLFFYRHVRLSHMYIFPKYNQDGDIIPVFRYIYWNISDGAKYQPSQYDEIYRLNPEDLAHIELAIIIPVTSFEEAKNKIQENIEEYQRMIQKYKMMDSLCE